MLDSLKRFYYKHPIISNLFFIMLSAVVLCWLGLLFLNIWTDHGAQTEVPDVRQLTYAEAANVLEKHDLKIEVADSIYDNTIPPGTVIETWPHPGAVIKPGREVYVTVTSFRPRQVVLAMPLTGVSSRQAITYLESLDIHNIRIVNVPSQYADLVERAKFNGKDIVPGMEIPVTATITLEVGKNFFEEEESNKTTDAEDNSDTDSETDLIDEIVAAFS